MTQREHESERGDPRAYYADAATGVWGSHTLEKRLIGLEHLLAHAAGKSVLDIGCAEGLVLREFMRRGAVVGHGVDVEATRIAAARERLGAADTALATVDVARFPWGGAPAFVRERYDVILLMGVLHRIAADVRGDVLVWLFDRCAEASVVRSDAKHAPLVDRIASERGFVLRSRENARPRDEKGGPVAPTLVFARELT